MEDLCDLDTPQSIGHSYDDLRRLSSEKISQSKMNPQSPKCITTQPSFVIDSLSSQIGNKSTFLDIDDDDHKSVDNYIITTNEQFENIHRNDQQTSNEMLMLTNSNIYHDEQPNWTYYSKKSDLFPSTLPSDLPIVQPDDDQHLSLTQTFLSHFHRRRKMPLANHSLSLNTTDFICSLKSRSIIDEQHQWINQTFFWKKISKQRTFRVRKSRVMASVDDIPSSSVFRLENLDRTIS